MKRIEIKKLLETQIATLEQIDFAACGLHVYNPTEYAQDPFLTYMERYATRPGQKILFLGMNPGPYGMAQTGVPFGEIGMVKNWLNISGAISRPRYEHPKRKIEGFSCTRSEVSGKRLWGLFSESFASAEEFFAKHTVLNYCPLMILSESGSNITPDKLPRGLWAELRLGCDSFLRAVIRSVGIETIVGVGKFAFDQGNRLAVSDGLRAIQILHPSPASPAANRGWAPQVIAQLASAGIRLEYV